LLLWSIFWILRASRDFIVLRITAQPPFGRLSRIGQMHDVHVYNLVAADTVEAAVLRLLDAKLSMFELVIGEIDMIHRLPLNEFCGTAEFARSVQRNSTENIFWTSLDTGAFSN